MSRPDLDWRVPRDDEYASLYRMMAAAYHAADERFPEDPAIFARYTGCDPDFSPDDWVAGWMGGEPVTALRIFARRIRVDESGRDARLAGIGNVATHPAHAGQGLGSMLLDRALAVLRARGFDLSLLYASRQDFYRRAGWVPLRSGWTRLELAGALSGLVPEPRPIAGRRGHAPLELRVVEAAGEEMHAALPAARRLYDLAYGTLPGAMVRSQAYWPRWIGGFALHETRARLLVAFQGLAPVAYLAGRHADEGLDVFEGFDATGEGAALLALARELDGAATVIRWPEVPWLDSILGTLEGKAAGFTRDAGMGRVVPGEGPFPASRFLLSDLDHF